MYTLPNLPLPSFLPNLNWFILIFWKSSCGPSGFFSILFLIPIFSNIFILLSSIFLFTVVWLMDLVSNFGNSTEPEDSLRFLALFYFFICLISLGSLDKFSLFSLLVK